MNMWCLQETLALVRKYDSIMDANAYLLEMTGDVLSAMDLIVSHLSGLLRDLKVQHLLGLSMLLHNISFYVHL